MSQQTDNLELAYAKRVPLSELSSALMEPITQTCLLNKEEDYKFLLHITREEAVKFCDTPLGFMWQYENIIYHFENNSTTDTSQALEKCKELEEQISYMLTRLKNVQYKLRNQEE